MNTFKKRIDELGRIVIPKQIRNNFKINNFDELEMSIDKDVIILKKSIGIEMYKGKLDRFLSFIKDFVNFKIIITDKNNVVSSNYEGIEYRNELNITINEEDYIDFPKLKGYIYYLPIIIDSNTIGNIYIVNSTKLNDKQILKKIKDIIIDILN